MKKLLALTLSLLACGVLSAQTTITALPAASALGGTEVMPCDQGGTTKKCSASQLATLAGTTIISGTPTTGNCAQFASASTLSDAGAPCGSVANPTGTIGLTAVNGSATSAIRSDGAPALSQTISPTWPGTHTLTNSLLKILGSSSGSNTFTMANASATNYTTTFPAATDTVVELAATQTLTNKTISGASNTLSNIPNASVTGLGTFATANAATPPAIGGTTPAAGAFTTLSASGNLTTNVTGSTQCLQVNSSGVVSGSASSCNPGDLYLLVCTHASGDDAAVNSILSTMYTNGGGTLRISGLCLKTTQMTFSNTGDSLSPTQPPIRITSAGGGTANGYWTGVTATYTDGLDLQYNAAVAKIITKGIGKLEIDHLNLVDGASDSAAFFITTNTTVQIHDNYFSGTGSGTSAVNDALIFGGACSGANGNGGVACATGLPAGAPQQGNTVDNIFQGYGSSVYNNFFDKMRRITVHQAAANGINVYNNTVSLSCGLSTGAPFNIWGADTSYGTTWATGAQDADNGNVYTGNYVEMYNYKWMVDLGKAQLNQFVNNGAYDDGSYAVGLFQFEAASQGALANLLEPGLAASALALTTGNAGIAATSTIINPNGAVSAQFPSTLALLGSYGSNYSQLNVQASASGQTVDSADFGDGNGNNYVTINTNNIGVNGRGWLGLKNVNTSGSDAYGAGIYLQSGATLQYGYRMDIEAGGNMDYALYGRGTYRFQDGSSNNYWTMGPTLNVSKLPLVSAGTAPTASGCSISAHSGGPIAGQYTSGTTGTCTVTLTLPATTTAYVCVARDVTTAADLQVQTGALSTTSVTITGTTVSGDVISWGCPISY